MSNIRKAFTPDLLKRIVIIFSVLLLEAIECVKTNGSFEDAAIFVNLTGVALFFIIMTRYKIMEFCKPLYAIYLVAGALVVFLVYHFFSAKDVFQSRFLVAEINVYLFGLIFIKIIEDAVLLQKSMQVEETGEQTSIKDRVIRFVRGNRPAVCVSLFLIMCVVSVNNSVWPLWFLMMFIPYYMVKSTKRDKEILFESIVDGLIVGFIIIQGHAFLFRPYYNNRYWGFFSNSNINALFYMVSYVAILVKLHILREKNSRKIIRTICYGFAGVLWSLTCFTVSRCSVMGLIVITLVFLIMEEWSYLKRGIKGFFISGILLFAAFIISVVPVYGLMRYVPQLRHHPIFFLDEYNNRDSIKVEDINNDELYVTLKDSIDGFLGRLNYANIEDNASISTGPSVDENGNTDYGNVNVTDSTYEAAYYKDIKYGKLDIVLGVRKYVWMYFSSHLNFSGHVESYERIQVMPAFACNHPHNSFLFIAYCFGIIPGLLFTIFVFGVPVYVLIKYKKKRNELSWHYLFTALVYIAFISFGFFETIAYPGRLAFLLLFMLYPQE